MTEKPSEKPSENSGESPGESATESPSEIPGESSTERRSQSPSESSTEGPSQSPSESSTERRSLRALLPRPGWLGPMAVAISIALTAWVWWLDRPPSPLPADAPLEQFAAGRALRHLERIAVKPHMPGSAEHGRVRDYIVAQLADLGFETDIHQATVVDQTRQVGPARRRFRAATVRSIVARKAGTDSTGGVALAAHYDSQQLAPGAGDDGAGVAAILEAVRAVGEAGDLRNDLYVIITDGEELGLMGARALVQEHAWWNEIKILLNFEGRGNAGQSVMFETSDLNGWVVREYSRAVRNATGSSLWYEIYRNMPNNTDFSIFKGRGVTGLNFALAEGADVYHRPTDTVDGLSLASLQHHGLHALELARHFGNLDITYSTKEPSVVFFRLGGIGVLQYRMGAVLPLSLGLLVLAGFVGMHGYRKRRLTIGGVAAGFALGLGAVLMAAWFAGILWQNVSQSHHELGSLVGRALYGEGWYLLAVVCLAVGAVSVLFGPLRRWFGVASLNAGALLIPLGLCVWTAQSFPAANMVIVWPTASAVGALGLMLSHSQRRKPTGTDLALFSLLSLPSFLLLVPFIWGLHVALNISSAGTLAVAVVVLLLTVLPLVEIATYSNERWLPALSFGLALAFALFGVIGARPGPRRPIPDDLIYALDHETGRAVWATMQEADDGWIESFVADGSRNGDLAPFLDGEERSYRLSRAKPIDSEPLVSRVVSDRTTGGVRTVRLEMRTAISPEMISVFPVSEGHLVLQRLNERTFDLAQPGTVANGADDGFDAPAAETGTWSLQHFGKAPDGALVLELRANPSEPIELAVVQHVMSLPEFPGRDTSRPATHVAHGRRLTDVSLFRQIVSIAAVPRSQRRAEPAPRPRTVVPIAEPEVGPPAPVVSALPADADLPEAAVEAIFDTGLPLPASAPMLPGRVRAGVEVEPPRKLFHVEPKYSGVARRAELECTVTIEAVIGRQGDVLDATVTSGCGLGLDEAALSAVSQWRYTPTLLNGRAVEVVATVTVNFRMRNRVPEAPAS